MTFVARRLLIVGFLLSSGSLAAQPAADEDAPPELIEQTIDEADLDGWKGRIEARIRTTEEQAKAGRGSEKGKEKSKRKAPEGKAANAEDAPDPFLIRAQILLDRAQASPGVIDGRDGSNMKKAVRAFETMRGLRADGALDPEVWGALAADPAKATMLYEITPEDINGRFEPSLPEDYGKLAELDWLGFRDVAEMLAERFHMDEELLRRLNPTVDFKAAGQKVLVADTGAAPEGKVARIVVDKDEGELRAYDKEGALVLANPATIGSEDTPSPTGRMKVNGSSPNPTYKYDPKKNFQQGDNKRKLNIPAGPNGPVGSMWIDLSKPTYGIHGAPEPSKIDKTESHGCVRLTNWDAEALAKLVQPGRTTVEFK